MHNSAKSRLSASGCGAFAANLAALYGLFQIVDDLASDIDIGNILNALKTW